MARTARGWRGMLALGVVAASVAVPAGAASARCAVDGAVVTGTDTWTRIAAPDFTLGGDTMTSYAVDELRPDRLFATNGISIAASTDGGCTWREAAIPAEQLAVADPLGGENGRVAQRRLVHVAVPFGVSDAVWAIGANDVVAGGTPLVEPRVLLSTDGGRSFAARTNGLPQFAKPLSIQAGTPTMAYLLLEETVPTPVRSLWVTTDAGARWTRLGDAPYDDVALDLFRGAVWAWNDDGLFVSRDLGRTWGSVPATSAPARVDVSPAFTTVAFVDGTRLDFVRVDSAIPGPAPEHVTSVAAGPAPGFVATSSVVSGVVVDPPFGVAALPYDATPQDATLSDLHLMQTLVDGQYLLYGFSPRALYRRPIAPSFSPPPRPPVDVTVKPPVLPPPPEPGLRPGDRLITLKPGEKRTVAYDLVLPPTPTPLDVYFMTDSTNSMRDAIAAVQEGVQDIVDDLTRAGIDLHFGVADFRDYPQAPGDKATYPYKRRREVGPIDDDLAEALESISTGGGNGADSALEAVYQAVTGAGRTGITASIPAGLGAEFRRDALKVVLVASDDAMREPKATEPWNAGPTKQAVIDALVRNDVEVVGIRVSSSSGGNPREQMVELAQGAGSVAPAAGVDCDGDGEADIDEGEALVCDFSSGQDIAPAFVGMLRGLKDLAEVHVGVTGPPDVVRHLGKETFANVNVKALNTLPVPVEYRCTPARYGTDTPVTIEGVLRSETLVSATPTVRCLAPAKAAPIVVPPPVLPKDPPKPLRAVAAPPPPPPQPNPNVNSNPNPNPNPQAQGQGGIAAEENQQQQLALAEMDITEDEELAFSALEPRNDLTPVVTLVAGALVACAAAGAQLHLARRVRAATNPSRGDRR